MRKTYFSTSTVFAGRSNPRDIAGGTVTPVVPFITYGFQDEAILAMCHCIDNGIDAGIVKSRDMGRKLDVACCI